MMRLAKVLPIVSLAGCACRRFRDDIRTGFFTYGIPEKCVVEELGRPSRTWTRECEYTAQRKKEASWEGGAAHAKEFTAAVCECFEYADRRTVFTFDVRTRRLVSWEGSRPYQPDRGNTSDTD